MKNNLERFAGKASCPWPFSARSCGARNGCANFMDAWQFLVLSAVKPHAHKISPFRGGGGYRCFWGYRCFFSAGRGFSLGIAA